MSLRLAVATEDLGPSLRKTIGQATSLEVSGVRLNTRSELNVGHSTDSAVRQTLHYVKERQMSVAGLYCPTRHALYDAEYLEPRLDIIRKSMSLCRQLETTELVVRCGRIPPEEQPSAAEPVEQPENPFSFATPAAAEAASGEASFRLLTELLNDLTQHGNHVGCVLNLHLAEYRLPLIRKLLTEVKGGPIRIVFDTATAIMTGADTNQTYRDLYDQVGYVRARDALKDVDGAGTEVAVGAGVVDWLQFLPTLVEADYQGWVSVERTGGENRKEDVRRGVSYLKTLIPQTGD